MAQIQTYQQKREMMDRIIQNILRMRSEKRLKWYLFAYDLNEQTGKYAELEEYLRKIDAGKVQESVYMIKSPAQTGQELWRQFEKYFDLTKERAIIAEIGDNTFIQQPE
jgi:CRISPR/Cas system-associated endoribonuclease Cas2